ncbi:MAG: histone deacetylase family protein [Pirellulaceae bacterium]
MRRVETRGEVGGMKIGWVYDARFLQHVPGGVHVEQPARLEVILQAVGAAGLAAQLEPVRFHAATADQLALVHDPAYVDVVRLMCEGGFTFIGSPDTSVCIDSYAVAALATGGVLAACDRVSTGEVARAFCAVRPPGHHAEADQAIGFCLFNHVAIAAEYLVRRYHLERVAIVDFDAHHGNGTQHIFERRRDVMYISLHERPEAPAFPGTGYAFERGQAAGTGYTLNLPLNRGCGALEYLHCVDRAVVPALEDYRPQWLLISAGFDALAADHLANLSLEPATFGPLTDRLTGVADRYCQGRVVSVLEGGYNLSQLGPAVVAHLQALCR